MTRKNDLRKKKRTISRPLQLIIALALLAAVAVLLVFVNRKTEMPEIESVYTYGELTQYSAEQVQSVSVTLRSGDSWTIVRSGGGMVLAEDDAFEIDQSTGETILSSVAVISYDRILTEDTTDYLEDLEDFGLKTPRVLVKISYSDGKEYTLRIGDQAAMEDDTWSYMLIDGDDRLFALDKGTVDGLNMERALLHTVEQPVIHKARLDDICFLQQDGTEYRWQLETEITSSDAALRWRVVSPFAYPADSESIGNLRTNLSNLRMGAYVGRATEEKLAECGFDSPRLVIRLHQAAGTLNGTGENGSITQVDWPESTTTITVGGQKNDNVDYVLWNDRIYITSHYSLNVFMSLQPVSTVSRYPVMIALDSLASLTVENEAGSHTWQLERETIEASEENAEETTLTICRMDGTEVSYDRFEAAYARLENVTVSGKLPEGYQATEKAHTTFTFLSTEGEKHTVSLTPFDALHDAVVIDGTALFYLIHDGMRFEWSDV